MSSRLMPLAVVLVACAPALALGACGGATPSLRPASVAAAAVVTARAAAAELPASTPAHVAGRAR